MRSSTILRRKCFRMRSYKKMGAQYDEQPHKLSPKKAAKELE